MNKQNKSIIVYILYCWNYGYRSTLLQEIGIDCRVSPCAGSIVSVTMLIYRTISRHWSPCIRKCNNDVNSLWYTLTLQVRFKLHPCRTQLESGKKIDGQDFGNFHAGGTGRVGWGGVGCGVLWQDSCSVCDMESIPFQCVIWDWSLFQGVWYGIDPCFRVCDMGSIPVLGCVICDRSLFQGPLVCFSLSIQCFRI